MFSPCRSICQCGPVEAGEHAGEFFACEFAAYWDHYPASQLPPASPALLSAQHQHGLPAERPLSLSGMSAETTSVLVDFMGANEHGPSLLSLDILFFFFKIPLF